MSLELQDPPQSALVSPLPLQDGFESCRRHAWLTLEIALRGSATWERLATHLASDQGDAFRQQLEAFVDQLILAGLDEDDATLRERLVAEMRQHRILASSFAAVADLDAESPLGAFVRLLSLNGQPIAEEVLAYFEAAASPYSQLVDGVVLTCRNLEQIVSLLPEHAREWAEVIDAPAESPAPLLPKRDDAENHYRRGLERMENADYRQAIIHFTAGLKLDGRNAELYSRRGDAYRLLNEPRRALSDYQVAVHLAPTTIAPLLGKALVHRQLGDFVAARADASAVLAISEQQPIAYRIRAAAAFELGDLEAALDDYNAAIELDADDIDAYLQRGKILVELDEFEDAVADLDRVLARTPQHVGALLYRAHARRGLGEHARAVRDYSEVLRHDPANALAYTCRGLAHELLGDRGRALVDHTEALRLDPENIAIYLNRAKLCRVTGDLARAHADLDDVLHREPGHFAALYHRGKIAIQNAQWHRALTDLDGVLQLNPQLAIAFASRAVVHDRLGQFSQALADADAAIELEPNSASAHLIRGMILVHSQDAAAAIPAFDAAIRLDAQLAIAYQERSVAATLKGDFDNALADINRWLDIEPGSAQAYLQRSGLLHSRGDIQQSLVDYSRALQIDASVVLNTVHPALAEQQRTQTSVTLANTIDGLRVRRTSAGAPKATEWTIIVESRKNAAARLAPKPEVIRPEPARIETLPRAEVIEIEPAPKSAVETMVQAPALVEEVVAEKSKRPAAETMTDATALVETVSKTPAVEKPVRKPEKQTALATPSAVAKAHADAKPKKKAKPEPGDLIPMEDGLEFDPAVEEEIQALLASVPAPTPPPAPKTIEFAKPEPVAANPAAIKSIDCPLCKRRLPPAEILSGGRFRCGNCNAVFFPAAATPAPTSFPTPAPAKAKPVQRPAARPADDDDEPTLLERFKKPKPLAITGVVALLVFYIWSPLTLFGNSHSYAVHPAKGEVLFDGKPVPGAVIRLVPVDPPTRDFPAASATADKDGKFVLSSYATEDGAAAGDFRVSVVRFPPPTARELKEENYRPRNMLPSKYANPETSGLTVRITAGENQIPVIHLHK